MRRDTVAEQRWLAFFEQVRKIPFDEHRARVVVDQIVVPLGQQAKGSPAPPAADPVTG